MHTPREQPRLRARADLLVRARLLEDGVLKSKSAAAAFSEDQEPTRDERHDSAEKSGVDLRHPAYHRGRADGGESRKGPCRDQRQRENGRCQ